MKVIIIKKRLIPGQTSPTIPIDGPSPRIQHKDEISAPIKLNLTIQSSLIKQPSKILIITSTHIKHLTIPTIRKPFSSNIIIQINNKLFKTKSIAESDGEESASSCFGGKVGGVFF
jgi:hypothetical protein